MNRKRKLCIILMVLVILTTFCACQNKDDTQTNNGIQYNSVDKGEEHMTLTQRQKDILEKAGLPTEYEKLNDNQKKSIIAIEEMFKYLDENYETSFEYVGYKAEGGMDKETLIVRPVGDNSTDVFSVVREKEKCTDNYLTVYYRDSYELMIETYMSDKVSLVQVFSEIDEVEEEIDNHDFRPAVSATTGIYFMSTSVSEDDLGNIAKAFGQWYASGSEGKSCSFSLYIVPEDVYWSITRFNRTNYNDKIISKINIIVRADGSVIVR